MSASYYGKVVVGFKLTSEEVTKEITKFHEDTGKSYKKKQVDYSQVSLDGVKMSKEFSKEIYDSDYEVEDLSGHQTTDATDTILGVALAESEDMNYGQEPQEFKPAIPPAVAKFAAKYGLTPKFYLVSYCSY